MWAWMFCLLICSASSANTTVFRHMWDTVAAVMGMHGKFRSDSLPSEDSIVFLANNYAMVTTGGDCRNLSANNTLEDTTFALVSKIKSHNPNVLAGMYWRTDMALEIAQCTSGTEEWNAHPEWHLKDDKGNDVTKSGHHMLDYSNKAVYDFFATLLLNVLKARLPSGMPVMNYLYLDGASSNPVEFAPGIGLARSQQLAANKLAFITDLQRQANALGHGQNVILNGVDELEVAQRFSSTGVAGVMIDHWSILQFLIRGKQAGDEEGEFNVTAMDALFDMVRSKALSNLTLHIKGWVGPIIKQKDQYPPSIPTPKTAADLQQVAGARFNSELALFLLVAEDTMYWMYSWFWGFDDWVPGLADSTVPRAFFPQAKCALGAPLGPPTRIQDTWRYSREYEHASVFVDLTNRTMSRVDFKDCAGAMAAPAFSI